MAVDIERIRAVTQMVLSRLDYQLWDVQYHRGAQGMVLKVTMEGLGGVTLDDCARVSRELSPALDVEELIAGPYALEVSSPGIERVLRTEAHFQQVLGEKVLVRMRAPLLQYAGRRQFQGELLAVGGGRVTIDEGPQSYEVALSDIVRAQVLFDWSPLQSTKGKRQSCKPL